MPEFFLYVLGKSPLLPSTGGEISMTALRRVATIAIPGGVPEEEGLPEACAGP